MKSATIPELETLLNDAAEGLTSVDGKKMFGCHALFAKGNVFALVWKHGRIGVKLPDSSEYSALMALEEATPWKAGPMQMAHWVLVPPSFHGEKRTLKKWVVRAHAAALAASPKAAKAPKKSAKKSAKR
ncbi:MAG: TfoX/Sxy family protein [Bdellovibrionota bacterium]